MWLYKNVKYLACLVCSDYKGWTCLHHAASEGYTQTMDILLSANLKLLNKTDEDGVWITLFQKVQHNLNSLLIYAFLCDDKCGEKNPTYVSCFMNIVTLPVSLIKRCKVFCNKYWAPSLTVYRHIRTLHSTLQQDWGMWLQSSSCWLVGQSSS